MRNLALRALLVGAVVWVVGGAAQAGPPIQAGIVAAEGQAANGSDGLLINSLNDPFTNGNGKVGFTGNLSNPAGGTIPFVWYDTGIVWKNTDDTINALTGAESTMGISNTGQFLYSPSVNGNDAVYSNVGVVLQETDAAPGLPGQFSVFNSRPTMKPDGTGYWVGGISTTQGGSTQNRVLFKAENAGAGATTPMLATGDNVGGFTIQAPSGLDFDYDLSDNNLHHAHVLDTDGATSSDLFVYVDGNLPAREGDPTGQGDNWSAFDIVSVNNSGDYIFTGNTDGPSTSDEFVAFNSQIVAREGDTLDGILLASGSTLRAASINNLGQVAHIWGSGSGSSTVETLFWGNGADLGSSSIKILAIGDVIDTDNNGTPDYQVFDFEASTVIGPGLDLGDDGSIFVTVALGPVGGVEEFGAVLHLVVPEPASLLLLSGAALLIGRRRRR